MPKVATSFSAKLSSWIQPFNTERRVFTTDGKAVFCNLCNKAIACERKFQIDQHIKTGLHLKAAEVVPGGSHIQQLLPNLSKQEDRFNEDLCHALVASGVPLWTLTKSPFRNFLHKYTNKHIPDESTLRKNYMSPCYDSIIAKIKEKVGKHYVYLVVDETTDPRGLHVANLLLGILSDINHRPFLIACKQLEKTNHETISRFINDSLKIISPNQDFNSRVLLLLTDAATYMGKVGKCLNIFYPNMIHVTCAAHGCHRLAERVREMFPDINSLINNGKKMFLKAPARINIYKEMLPGKSLPPQPVITRWGTWLKSALFYAENYHDFVNVVNKIKQMDDAQSITKIVNIIGKKNVVNELAFIKTYLPFIVHIIKSLENKNLSLNDSCELIDEFEQNVNSIPGSSGEILKSKFKEIIEKNKGLATLRKINKILCGDCSEHVEIDDPLILSKFKFAPVTSVDVERSFSIYKYILSDRKFNFTEANFEKYMIIHCNAEIE